MKARRDDTAPKPIAVIPVPPPPPDQRVKRNADFAPAGQKSNRYSLPTSLDSTSPVGYRTRIALTQREAEQAMQLLALDRPTQFSPAIAVTEQEMFEETSLGILTSRQSTNFRGHRQVTFGPQDSIRIGHLLRSLQHSDGASLDNASYTHVVLARPYRTPFTLLLTFVGHKPVISTATVAVRAWQKRFQHTDDIPTIGYLQHLHIGILADAAERATVLASNGKRRAQVFMRPFCGQGRKDNRPVAHALEEMCELTLQERSLGWKVALVIQVGQAIAAEQVPMSPELCRKIAANILAFRSERIMPGVNQEEKAPAGYQKRQTMDVPDELSVQCGRAAYNAFAHWTGTPREKAKQLLLLERIDVLTDAGKARLRYVRDMLSHITDKVVSDIPLWVDLPTGKQFSKNAERGRKAFALVGQRVYIAGLARKEIAEARLDWEHAVRAMGAAAARGALVAELTGLVDLPSDCDQLCGVCLMAGPVNQNDIGKQFYGTEDLLAHLYKDRDPTSLLVWTLKAKTIADPIGNEEQLLNAARQGALVDLRPGPHEVVKIKQDRRLLPLRKREGRVSSERAFSDQGNFVTSPEGREIAGNRGSTWPKAWAEELLWEISLLGT